MSKGLAKVRNIQFDIPADEAAAPPSSIAAAPVPAPAPTRPPYTGIMRHSASVAQAQQAQARIQQLEQERGAQKMDPTIIRPSRWANRHAAAFQAASFEALRSEIADAGGNVQPIKVRPLVDDADGDARYEIVFGHRRHRACLELGLPVLAVVQEFDDRQLWIEMERENRNREGLSAWEQGMMYRRALDAGLFPSLRMLAQDAGLNPATVSKALAIANLPEHVVAAFPSPIDIQHKWASELRAAVERNQAAVLAEAESVEPGTPAAQVFARLTAVGVAQGNTPTRRVGVARGNNHTVDVGVAPGNISVETAHEGESLSAPSKLDLGHGHFADVRTESGRAVIELDASLLDAQAWSALEKALRKALTKKR